MGFLCGILFLNIVELIMSLCGKCNCHCPDCDCCDKGGSTSSNKSVVRQTTERNTERNEVINSERNVENHQIQVITVTHKKTVVEADGNNIRVRNVKENHTYLYAN